MTSKVDYKNMSNDELEEIAPDDPDAAWELFLRLPHEHINPPNREVTDPNTNTQSPPPIVIND